MVIWITDRMADYRGLTPADEDYHRLLYMVKVFYINITKFIITFAIALLLGIAGYFLFFSLIYGIMRAHGFGIHLKSSTLCTISGAIVYYGCIYLARVITLPAASHILAFILMAGIYWRYAPAESKNQPIGKTRKKRLKIRLMLIITLLCLISLLLNNGVYRNLILFSVLAEMLNILPVTYKLIERWKL